MRPLPDGGAHLEVVEQFGIRMHSFERNGRMRLCYDGELFQRVLSFPRASAEERAQPRLGSRGRTASIRAWVRSCAHPSTISAHRSWIHRGQRIGCVDEESRARPARSRMGLHCLDQARRGGAPRLAAQRALAELLAVNPSALGVDRRGEYDDAVVRVSAIRWAAVTPVTQTGPLTLSAAPGEPGQTCVELQQARQRRAAPLVRRCTYGIVWMASAQAIPQGPALVLAVQPLESWRELWVFHQKAGAWTIDVLSPGLDDPEEGYVEFAGFVPGTRRLLVAREVKDRGRFRPRFEELRLEDLALVRQASSPDLLRNFGRWQDVTWRRDTLALRR